MAIESTGTSMVLEIESLQPKLFVATNFTVYVPALIKDFVACVVEAKSTEFRYHLKVLVNGLDVLLN